MRLKIRFGSGDVQEIIEVAFSPLEYVLKLKEMLVLHGTGPVAILVEKHGGPYSPDVQLSLKGIELNNMFPLEKYGIQEGDVLHLRFGSSRENAVPVGKEKNEKILSCGTCGRVFDDPDMLRYHRGNLAPQEWVYGITVKWEWSCCGKIVSTPESCYHPEGCAGGICPECRKDCPCYQAREIRRGEEEGL